MAEWPQEDVANDTAYKLVISQQRANSEPPQELIVLGQSYILTDLSPNSTYCLTVSAWSETNVGPASDAVCLETGQAS